MNRITGIEKVPVVTSSKSYKASDNVKLNKIESSLFPSNNNFQEVDGLTQLKANISQLEDLHFRLNYMMGEVKGLLKR